MFGILTIQESAQYKVKVTKVLEYSEYIKIEGYSNLKRVNVYLTDADTILIGSTYYVKGKLSEPINNTIPNTFNYKDYLYSKNTKYIISGEEITLQKKGFSIYIVGSFVDEYIEKYLPESKRYIKTFILADKSEIDQNVINDINLLGISHMFAVSGYHIGLLVLGISWIFNKLSITKKKTEIIIIFILCIYMLITSFTASVVRASLLYILIVVNKHYKLKMSVLDLLSIIYITLLLIRPYYFYNLGFVLSFGVTFILILSQKILKNYRKFSMIVVVSFIAFLASLPIVLNANYQINLLTLIFNVMIIYIMSIVVFPFTYITFIISIFDKPLSLLYWLFEGLLGILSNIHIFVIKGYFTNELEIMIVYGIIMSIFVLFEQKKSIKKVLVSLTIVIAVFINTSYIDPRSSISFLDVEGDSTFIRDQFNRCNILIDTGESDDYDSVIHYIRSQNVRKIDYLIISHFHSDHFGEVDDVIDEFKIGQIISKNNVTSFENQKIQCGNIELFIYPMSYSEENENNNSIVLSVFIEDKHYLFVGDSEIPREQEFIEQYRIDVNYLKVGHHGSDTSSSSDFLTAINPEEVFIIVDRENHNHHPSKTVIERYEELQIPIHRTDLDGTIQVIYLFGKEMKKYYRP